MRFKNRFALVTGAGKGIGASTGRRLASEGAAVAVNDIDSRAVEELVHEITSAGGEALAAPADLADHNETESMTHKVLAEFGRIDVLVNNVGGSCRALGRYKSFLDQTPADVDWEIRINLQSAIVCAQHALPSMMRNQYGRIVNLSSITGTVGMAGIPVYSATKGGVISLTKALAMMYGEYGITVNAVAPGAVATRPGMEKLGDTTFLNRACSPNEIANLICFLASDHAAYITGQNFVMDGGRTLGPKIGGALTRDPRDTTSPPAAHNEEVRQTGPD